MCDLIYSHERSPWLLSEEWTRMEAGRLVEEALQCLWQGGDKGGLGSVAGNGGGKKLSDVRYLKKELLTYLFCGSASGELGIQE